MDEIQKVLIKAGRKDLAQKYYKKFAKKKDEELMFEKESDPFEKTIKDISKRHSLSPKDMKNFVTFYMDMVKSEGWSRDKSYVDDWARRISNGQAKQFADSKVKKYLKKHKLI